MSKLIPAISATEPALDIAEACEFLGGINPRTLSNYTKKGSLKAYQIGGRFSYLESDLRAFAVPQVQKPKPDLRAGKTSPETIAELRRQGFKI